MSVEKTETLQIKTLIVDVDGTLTDGMYHVSEDGVISKTFYTRDFAAMDLLAGLGVSIVILSSASDSVINQKINSSRMQHKKNINIYTGIGNKTMFLFLNVGQKIELNNAAYIGDGLNDLEAMDLCGFTGCPSDAHLDVAQAVSYVCDKPGGKGAVEEFIDFIIKSRIYGN